VNHLGRKAEEILDSLCTVPNQGRGPSIIKYLLLYKQVFVRVIVCAGPICVCATGTHVVKTQVVGEMDLEFGRSHFLCCYQWKLRGFGVVIFLWPHQSTDIETGLKISCCGESEISVSYAKRIFSEVAWIFKERDWSQLASSYEQVDWM